MRFAVKNRIAAPLDEVQRAFVDPAFYEALADLPDLAPPEVVECREDGDDVTIRVRYVYTGHLPPPARAVLDPAKLSWLDEATMHVSEHRADFRIRAEHYPDRLSCSGTYAFVPGPGDSTVHQVTGDLRVHFPVVGGLVERAIARGMQDHLGREARICEQWLAGRG